MRLAFALTGSVLALTACATTSEDASSTAVYDPLEGWNLPFPTYELSPSEVVSLILLLQSPDGFSYPNESLIRILPMKSQFNNGY